MGIFGRARAYIGIYALKYLMRKFSPSTDRKLVLSKIRIVTEKQRAKYDELSAQIDDFQKSYDYSIKLMERAEREIGRAKSDDQVRTIIEKYAQLAVQKQFRLENELEHLQTLLKNVGRPN